MIPRPPPAARFTAWLQRCGILFILIGMTLAWCAAGWNVVHVHPHLDSIALGGLVYLAVAGVGIGGLRFIYRRSGPWLFLWIAVIASVLIQLGVILAANSSWVWTGDNHIFKTFLDRLAGNGYAAETLRELSRHYDYPLWTRRALPFYYVLRTGFGDHFVRAVQIFQALLVSLSLVLTWRTARILFGRRVAFWTVCLQFIMPFRWFACLDLNHYLPGGFYFLAALWVLAEWTRGRPGIIRRWSLALCTAILLGLMSLEGGLDRIYLISVAGLILLLWAGGNWSLRQSAMALGAWIVVPVLLSVLVLRPVNSGIDQANAGRLSGGTVAFMARGWMPETGGEYSATYEHIDCLTPPENKAAMQASLLASQAFYNTGTLLFRLVPEKMAKYFLLGYASGTEEMLRGNGATEAATWAKGARTAFLLTVLPLMILGGLLLLPRLHRTRWLCLILPCAFFCAATSLVGETSPRYSIYVQPFFFMLGAQSLALSAPWRKRILRAVPIPGFTAFSSLGILYVALGLGLLCARPWLQRHVVMDMNSWTASSAGSSQHPSRTLAPFELHLEPLPNAPTWGSVRIPADFQLPAQLSFYILPRPGSPAGQSGPAILRRETSRGITEEKLALPSRVVLNLNPGDSHFFELLSLTTPPPFSLTVGYAHFRPKVR